MAEAAVMEPVVFNCPVLLIFNTALPLTWAIKISELVVPLSAIKAAFAEIVGKVVVIEFEK